MLCALKQLEIYIGTGHSIDQGFNSRHVCNANNPIKADIMCFKASIVNLIHAWTLSLSRLHEVFGRNSSSD